MQEEERKKAEGRRREQGEARAKRAKVDARLSNDECKRMAQEDRVSRGLNAIWRQLEGMGEGEMEGERERGGQREGERGGQRDAHAKDDDTTATGSTRSDIKRDAASTDALHGGAADPPSSSAAPLAPQAVGAPDVPQMM